MKSDLSPSSVGIAIATFNSADVVGECLAPLAKRGFVIVLADDGSSDSTIDVARAACPDIHIIEGDGSAWWAGGTRRAVERCFALGCEAVLMLNPDVIISAEGVLSLARHARAHPLTIAAALVVDRRAPDRVAWAGAHFRHLGRGVPIRTFQYIAKRGSPVSALGSEPFDTDEVHGRGVLITREVYQRIGVLDDATFPQYGADTDYSIRALRLGVRMQIVPTVRAELYTENSGMAFEKSLGDKVVGVGRYLTDQKYGDALRVLWVFYRRHLPWYEVVPTYTFSLFVNVMRRLLA